MDEREVYIIDFTYEQLAKIFEFVENYELKEE